MPTGVYARSKTLKERFYEKFVPEPNSGCWLWGASSLQKNGYGMIFINYKRKLAHRISWELHNGPIPGGLCVLHKCDIRLCVNPAHLFLGTYLDNNRDTSFKKRHWCQKKTHCPKGHSYSGDNLQINTNGSRRCRKCHNNKEMIRRQNKQLCGVDQWR